MDRKLPPEIIKKRRRKLIINLSIASIATVALFLFLVSILRTGISSDDVYTSTVDRGAIEISIPATGKVVPLSEEVIISPVSTKILEVYKKAGDPVETDEAIIRLDLDAIRADIEKQNDELSMKRYKLEQQKQASQSALSDLEMQIEIDEMRIKRMEVLLRNEMFLDSIGAGTSDKIRQAELEYSVEQLKIQQLRLKYENLKQSSLTDTKVLELDYNIALKNANLKTKTMSEAQVRSPRSATLTWVNDQIGSSVAQGAQLAIVSDLKHYKVEAEISDSYGNKVLSGNKVIVKISNKELTGIVGNIVPSVKNGIINFAVLLDDNENTLLRSGLKVDVYVVSAIQENTLRIASRSYYTGAGEYELWVVGDNEAKKRKIILGESSYNYVEVKEGLSEGEIVITSDMNRYLDRNKVKFTWSRP
ncbi:MAG: HlyD family efflux transporter periplasmic adaptor subunit [Prevotellaceae bacterium]|jgi:HlyD family secretion protein|nr:HlyD family efflux transporter periplasmic adaptor subunit [Prevotellaceae bacterium]